MTPAELLSAAQTAASHGMLREALLLLDQLGDVPVPRLWILRADLHRERSDLDAARVCLDRAAALGAGAAAAFRQALLMAPVMGDERAVQADLDRMEAGLRRLVARPMPLRDPVNEVPWLDFYLAYRGGEDRFHRELLGQALRACCPALAWRAPQVDAPRSGRLRIGLCSSHMRDHTIGRLNEALVDGLGAHGLDVVLLSPDPPTDDMARRLHDEAAESVVLGRNLGPARERIAAAKVDVLHFPDVGMDPFTYLLAMSRLAPIQTVSWGHPITTGLPSIDALLASEGLVPTGTERRFSEQVVRLPDPMVCWRPPADPPPMDRAALGLPEGRRVYLCPQNPFKLHPAFDRALGALSRRDPEGRIVLLASKKQGWQARLMRRLSAQVPDAAERVVWAPRQPRQGYLALLQAADVLLDPFPFAGGHTSLEAFAMGTPIATWPTDQLRGRITATWYAAMGLGDLVARDLDDYVGKAVAWATAGPERDRVRSALVERRGRLFEQTSAVTAHAAVFSRLAQQARRQVRR